MISTIQPYNLSIVLNFFDADSNKNGTQTVLSNFDMLVVVCCVTEWSSGGSRKIDSQSEKISYFTRIFTSIQFSSNGSLVYWPKVILHFGTKIYRLALPKAGFQKMFAFQLFFIIIKHHWWCVCVTPFENLQDLRIQMQ